jgi:hypothetical protein
MERNWWPQDLIFFWLFCFFRSLLEKQPMAPPAVDTSSSVESVAANTAIASSPIDILSDYVHHSSQSFGALLNRYLQSLDMLSSYRQREASLLTRLDQQQDATALDEDTYLPLKDSLKIVRLHIEQAKKLEAKTFLQCFEAIKNEPGWSQEKKISVLQALLALGE